jgi:hypothetical protein
MRHYKVPEDRLAEIRESVKSFTDLLNLSYIIRSARDESLVEDICRALFSVNLMGLRQQGEEKGPSFVQYEDGIFTICAPPTESAADCHLVRTPIISLLTTGKLRLLTRENLVLSDTSVGVALGQAVRQIVAGELKAHCASDYLYKTGSSNYAKALRGTKMMVLGQLFRKLRPDFQKRLKPGLRALSGFGPEKSYKLFNYEELYKYYGISEDASSMKFLREMIVALANFVWADEDYTNSVIEGCILPAQHALRRFYDKIPVKDRNGRQKLIAVKPESPASVQYLTNLERREIRSSELNNAYLEYTANLANAPSIIDEIQDSKIFDNWYSKCRTSAREAYVVYYKIRRLARQRMLAYSDAKKLTVGTFSAAINTFSDLPSLPCESAGEESVADRSDSSSKQN